MNRHPDTSRGVGRSEVVESAGVTMSCLATITVTYQPDLEVLHRQLQQLPVNAVKIIVDNGTQADVRDKLEELVASVHMAELVVNRDNVGLAAGLNIGLRAVSATAGVTHVLLLDQDTEPGYGQAEKLYAAYFQLMARTDKLGCIGPNLVDPATGLSHGFHRMWMGMWKRVFPARNSQVPVACDNLNGSGTLMALALVDELGGLDEGLFIDHVDTEWIFRVKAAEYGVFGIPNVHFQHRMGERSLRIWLFGWRVWPYRSPQRHYYLFRNTLRLMRRGYVPLVWKIWAAAKMLLTAVAYFLADQDRRAQWQSMVKGARDGLDRTRREAGVVGR